MDVRTKNCRAKNHWRQGKTCTASACCAWQLELVWYSGIYGTGLEDVNANMWQMPESSTNLADQQLG